MDFASGGYWKDYLREVARAFWVLLNAPTLWSSACSSLRVSAVFGLADMLGIHLGRSAFSIFLVSLLALVIKMPYRLYAEQRATIHSLNERLTPKISIISPPDGINLYPAADGSLWKYVQFIVRSTTDVPLIDCEAWLRAVDRLNPDGSKASLVEEAIHCSWSNRDPSLHLLTIPAKISLNANIFAVNDKHDSVLQVQTSPIKILLPTEIQTPGRYRISIAVTAKDAMTRESSFIFHWGGSFDDIRMTPEAAC